MRVALSIALIADSRRARTVFAIITITLIFIGSSSGAKKQQSYTDKRWNIRSTIQMHSVLQSRLNPLDRDRTSEKA